MNRLSMREFLKQALLEDIGYGDLTTEAIFSERDTLDAYIVAKQEGRIAGLDVMKEVFWLLDEEVEITLNVAEAEDVEAGTVIARLSGKARPLLSGERVALNLMQRMSGIATMTRDICRLVKRYPVRITDTRKTVPGLRVLDRLAVRAGGARNHRFGLFDAVLIKDNHIDAAGSITAAVEKVKRNVGHMVKIEVETETLPQVEEALRAGADVILLDNMEPHQVKQAVDLINGRAVSEASGNMTPQNVEAYAATGVDVISLGWLTHSVRAMDLSMKI